MGHFGGKVRLTLAYDEAAAKAATIANSVRVALNITAFIRN